MHSAFYDTLNYKILLPGFTGVAYTVNEIKNWLTL